MTSDLPTGFALLLILATGYCFVTLDPVMRRQISRYDGQRLYLIVVVTGLLLFFASYVLLVALDEILAITPENSIFTYNHDPKRDINVPALFFALFLAIFMPKSILRFKESPEDDLVNYWREDDLDWLMFRAMDEHKTVIVSLDSRKTYIGFISDGLEPEKERSFITIIPLYSGYRDRETLNLCLENNYDGVRQRLQELVGGDCSEHRSKLLIDEITDYRLVIPRKTIVSMGIAAQFKDPSGSHDTPNVID